MGTRDNVIKKDDNKIQLSDMWTVLENEIAAKIPNYIKRLLTCMGYDSILVLGQLNLDIIEEIKTYAQSQFIYRLKDEDEKNDFLSFCPYKQLKLGHVVLLQAIAKLINETGMKYFIDQLKVLQKYNQLVTIKNERI